MLILIPDPDSDPQSKYTPRNAETRPGFHSEKQNGQKSEFRICSKIRIADSHCCSHFELLFCSISNCSSVHDSNCCSVCPSVCSLFVHFCWTDGRTNGRTDGYLQTAFGGLPGPLRGLLGPSRRPPPMWLQDPGLSLT